MGRRGKKCIIPGCKSYLEMKKRVSLHWFPKNEYIRKQWIEAITTPSWVPNIKKYSVICSNHFEEVTELETRTYLDPEAIPRFESYRSQPLINEQGSNKTDENKERKKTSPEKDLSSTDSTSKREKTSVNKRNLISTKRVSNRIAKIAEKDSKKVIKQQIHKLCKVKIKKIAV